MGWLATHHELDNFSQNHFQIQSQKGKFSLGVCPQTPKQEHAESALHTMQHSVSPPLHFKFCYGMLFERHATAIGLLCRLLDGEGRGDLQSFIPHFVTSIPRRSSRLNNLSDLARALRLQNPITFRTLDCYHRSWHGAISSIWNTLPANLLFQGHDMGWHSVLKALQRCCC